MNLSTASTSLLPPGSYRVIYADPPWHMSTWSDKGRSRCPDGLTSTGSPRHYPTLDLPALAKLPISAFAADDAVLFLWTTWPHIEQAFPLIRAWGFDYSGLAWEWIKYNPVTNKYAFGTGYGTRKNVEPCLLARRGNLPILSHSERDFIMAPRREHSRKPDEARTRIERMFPGPRLELFARDRRPGWHYALSPELDRFPEAPTPDSPSTSAA